MNRYSVGPVRLGTALPAGLLAIGVMLGGCSSASEPAPDTSASASAGASAGATASATASVEASASATSTLSAEEQLAFEQATEVVLAYEQAFYEILDAAEPQLNALNGVVAQPQLATDLENLQRIVGGGAYTIESTGPSVLVSVKPIKLDPAADPPTVVLLACVDQTAATGTQEGRTWTGPREQARYRVVRTSYLPEPGWAVARVLPPSGNDQPKPC